MAIVKRLTKGSALTHAELDGNFTDLDTRVSTLEGAPDSDSQTLTLVGTDLSISSGNTVDLSGLGGGAGGIALTDLSVTVDPAGSANLAYDNTTGVFTYTPPDLSSYLTSYTETDPVVGAVTGIVKSDGAGNISAAVAGTDYSTFDGNYGSLSGTPTLFSGVFADLTSKPTTLAGYGITDALTLGGALTGSSLEAVAVGAGVADGNDLTITGGDATEINSTGGDANITGGSGALTSGNVNIGTTQTVAVSIGASGVGTSIGGTLTANGNAIFNTGVQEKFATLTGSTGVTAMDCDNGQVFYLTGAAGDITANFTNLGLTAEYGTNVTVIINQGATPYEVTAVQIGGSAQTIEWQGGSAPTGNANGIDSFSFTILRDGGSYVVLGQMVDFT